MLSEPICGSNPKYLTGRVFLGKMLFHEKDCGENTDLTVQRKPKPWCQKQGVILVSSHIISLNHCLLLNIHLRGLCPLQSDTHGKLEKAARSLEKLYSRKYLGLGLILSLCDVETLFFFLTVVCALGWRTPLLSAALFPSLFSFKFKNSLFFVLQNSC